MEGKDAVPLEGGSRGSAVAFVLLSPRRAQRAKAASIRFGDGLTSAFGERSHVVKVLGERAACVAVVIWPRGAGEAALG